jgi:hypothetical protein
MSIQTLDLISSSLDNGFPDEVVILRAAGDKVWCYYYRQTHCMAVFSNETNAMDWVRFMELHPATPWEMTFDDVYDLAKTKGAVVKALILLDDPQNPVMYEIQY